MEIELERIEDKRQGQKMRNMIKEMNNKEEEMNRGIKNDKFYEEYDLLLKNMMEMYRMNNKEKSVERLQYLMRQKDMYKERDEKYLSVEVKK